MYYINPRLSHYIFVKIFLRMFCKQENDGDDRTIHNDVYSIQNRMMAAMQLKVLVCDDSILVRRQLRDLLEELGCSVIEAKNGLEGVKLYQEEKPDAVFLDIVMPEMDGLQALQAICEFDIHAKVVMVSSAATATYVKQALQAGAYSFIQKPYTKTQISQVVLAIGR